jgi:hypothetical protein
MLDSDYAAIRELRKCRALVGIEDEKLPTGPAVIIGCGDKDRAPEMIDFARDVFRRRNGKADQKEEFVHLILLNGGGLLIPDRSPLSRHMCCGVQVPMDLAVIQQIREGAAIKNATIIGVSVHFPCGMAAKHHMRVEDVLDYAADAKVRLRQAFPGFNVIGFIHVDYDGREHHHNGKRFKTYVIKREPLKQYFSGNYALPFMAQEVEA